MKISEESITISKIITIKYMNEQNTIEKMRMLRLKAMADLYGDSGDADPVPGILTPLIRF